MKTTEYIIGISDGHDAGACLINGDGEILFATSEERFTRTKHQRGVPKHSLRHIKIMLKHKDELDSIRLIAIGGVFRKEKRLLELKKYLAQEFSGTPIVFFDHHLCHAASTYYTSGHRRSLVLTLDAAGDGLSGSISIGMNGQLITIHNISYLESIGDFFASITELLGYRPMSDEHKVASMAAYSSEAIPDEELKSIIDYDITTHAFVNKLEVVGFRATKKLSYLLNKYDPFVIARSSQEHLIKLVMRFFEDFHDQYHVKHVSFAGGIAGNVQLNMLLREHDNVDDLWVFPHMGDGGLCVGAALEALARLKLTEGSRLVAKRLKHVYLGPDIKQSEIDKIIEKHHETITVKQVDPREIIPQLLEQNKFVGLMNGRMEFGPRALGNRSLLANPTIAENQRILNDKKGRPWFQPFAPTILAESGEKYLLNYTDSPFMTMAFRVTDSALKTMPATIHADKTTRPQTLGEENSFYREIIENVSTTIGIPVVLNTSLNLHGDPIVHSPKDGMKALKKGLVDALIINDLLIVNKF